MKTTFVERNNSNAEVFRRANEAIKAETPDGKIPKTIKPFIHSYLNARMKRLARIRLMPRGHPVRHITLGPDPRQRTVPWDPPNRRVGRPRFKWVTETMQNVWNNTRHTHRHIPQLFDNQNIQQHEAINMSLSEQSSAPAFLYS